MPIFIERFLLPLFVTVIVVFIFNNLYKFDWHQIISLGVGILTIAYFASYTLHKSSLEKEASETAVAAAPPQRSGAPPSPAPISQTTKGNNSPIVQGNGNSVVITPPTISRETPTVAVHHIAILAGIREGEILTVEIAFSNIGKAIARSVHQQTTVVSTDEAFDPQWSILRSTLDSRISSDLPQGVVKSMKTPVPILQRSDERPQAARLPKDVAEQILSGRRKIGVAGIFRYSDDDGHKFETTYCAVYNPVKHPFFDECPKVIGHIFRCDEPDSPARLPRVQRQGRPHQLIGRVQK